MEWRPTTPEVSPDGFDEVISSHRMILLHFWAGWNQYDRGMDAALAEIRSEYEGQVFFGSVDSDHHGHWQKCRELGILNLPAITFFADGKHIETMIGMRPKEELSKKIREWIIASLV